MKDIPVFTSAYGIASLALREIPYRQSAYITLYDTQSPALLLEECVGFCRACGAQKIFATGHNALQRYPVAASVIEMEAEIAGLAAQDAALIPVTAETVRQWRDISNRHMADVAISAYLTAQDDKTLVADGDAYFVQKDGILIGIGKASGDRIHTVVSVVPGMGETIVRTLASTLRCEKVRLTVADTNLRAVRLYDRLGFTKKAVLSCWYHVY